MNETLILVLLFLFLSGKHNCDCDVCKKGCDCDGQKRGCEKQKRECGCEEQKRECGCEPEDYDMPKKACMKKKEETTYVRPPFAPDISEREEECNCHTE